MLLRLDSRFIGAFAHNNNNNNSNNDDNNNDNDNNDNNNNDNNELVQIRPVFCFAAMKIMDLQFLLQNKSFQFSVEIHLLVKVLKKSTPMVTF